MHPHDYVVPAHPPSAPPAPRPRPQPETRPSVLRRAPPSAGAAAFGLGLGPADRATPALLQSHTPRLLFDSKQGGHAANGAADPLHRDNNRPPPHHPQQLRQNSNDHLGAGAATVAVSGRGSLQHTLQSARSSAYSHLTLQQPAAAASAASTSARHLSNSPSPNSTPVRSNAAAYSRGFDRLHVFDSSPLASPKDLIAMAGPGGGRHGHGHGPGHGAGHGSHRASVGSVFEFGTNMLGAGGAQQSNHQRGASELQRKRSQGQGQSAVALSWPNDLLSGGGTVQRQNSQHVRQSQPLPSPPAPVHTHTQHHGNNFPAILKRGAQLIEEAPPVLSPALAHQLQLDDYADDLDYDDDASPALPPPDFSAAFSADDRHNGHGHGHTAAANPNSNANPNRVSKNGRIGSGARSTKKAGAGAAAAGGTVGGGPLAGMKKLDVASAQAFRSPYTRKSFAKVGAAAKSKAAVAAAEESVLPAEEWVAGASSDSDEHDSFVPIRASAGLGPTGTHRQHPSSGSGFGDGDGGDGGGWTLDVGVAEDANPRFRASMEDATVVRRSFGPRFFPRHSAPTPASAPLHEDDDSPHSASAASAAAASAHATVAPLRGSFFGVYDGHGGRATVDFMARHFHRELARKLSALGGGASGHSGGSSADVAAAIESTCRTVDGAMAPRETAARCYGDDFQDCGSTACVAYLRPCGRGLRGRELFLANVGDAQAVLALDKAELQRIKQAESASSAPDGDKKGKRGSSASGAAAANRDDSPPLSATLHARQVSTDRTPKKAAREREGSGAGVRTSRAGSVSIAMGGVGGGRDSSLAKTLARPLQSGGGGGGGGRSAPRLTALPMSYAHVATDPKEMARIKAAGGCVFASTIPCTRAQMQWLARSLARVRCSQARVSSLSFICFVRSLLCSDRVSGCLAVARAFGDWSLKSGGVSSVPFQQRVRLTDAHKFLVIACDGTFDVLSHADVVDIAAQHVHARNGGGGAAGGAPAAGAAQRAAEAIVAEALRRGTTDNVSVIVVAFGRDTQD